MTEKMEALEILPDCLGGLVSEAEREAFERMVKNAGLRGRFAEMRAAGRTVADTLATMETETGTPFDTLRRVVYGRRSGEARPWLSSTRQ